MGITQNGVLQKDDNGYPVFGGTSSADDSTVLNVAIDPVTRRVLTDVGGGGSGTVTSVSVVSANGFAGTVATATTTPAITLTTTVTGLLKGNGTAISAAVANTDFQSAITLTTTGTSGVSTFNGTTLNIPNYGGGNVSNTGTPVDNQIAVWTSATVIEGTSGLTYSGTNLQLTGDIGSTGTRITKGWFTDLTVTNAIAGSVTGNAATVTTQNEATDTTCFVSFASAASGSLPVLTNTNMTFNSNTGVVTFASSILTTTDINGGTVDGTTIGASAASTILATTIGGTVITGNSFVPNLSTIPTNGMYLPAANTLGWGINSAAELQLTSTALSPAADGGNSLGTTALGWQNLFGNTGFVFNIENSDWVATHTAGILTVGTGDLRVTTAGTNTASVVTVGGTQTLTAKNVTRRVVTVNAPGATPTTTVANVDIANFTGLATAITSMTTNLANTGAVDGQKLMFRFTDDGTARAITWGASFGATTMALPTTTVISTMLRVGFEYNGSIWQCVSVV